MYKIAIAGKANSGKNTLSRFLCEEINEIVSYPPIVGFADPIKEMSLIAFPFLKREDFFGPSENRSKVIPNCFKDGKPLTIRILLQDIGEGYKKYSPTIWIDVFNETYKKYIKKNNFIICSDLRFTDEFNFLKKNGFFLIRLLKNNSSNMNHISETQQNQIKDESFDYIIHNNGTLDDLKIKVREIVNLIKT